MKPHDSKKTPTPWIIREAIREDAPTLFDFVRQLSEAEGLAHENTGSLEMLERSLFGPRPFAHALLALLDGEPAGMAIYYFGYSTFQARPMLCLEDLFVAPAARSQGMGRAFFERLGLIASQEGCGRFEWAVQLANTRAIRLYQSLGARQLADWARCRLEGESLKALAPKLP